MDQESKLLGTGVRRISTGLRDFLDSPQNNKGPYHYPTTQYSDDDDVPDTFPPPTNALKDDFPSIPTLMGNLVLQKVNLWVGKWMEGSSSGLYHDFHDKLYCLLQGPKRLVFTHPINLITYTRTGSSKKSILTVSSPTIIPFVRMASTATMLRNANAGAKEADVGIEVELKIAGYGRNFKAIRADEDFASLPVNDADDADAVLAKLEAQEKKGKGEDEEEEWGGIGGNNEDESDDEEDPSSFSGIPTSVLHSHLNLPTTTAPPSASDLSTSSFLSSLKSPGPSFIVNLKAGEMLYREGCSGHIKQTHK